MFWNNKKLIEERDIERSRAVFACQLLDNKSREYERLIASSKISIDESANKLIQEKQEIEKHVRSLEALLESTVSRLKNCQLSLDHFSEIVEGIHSIAVGYSTLQIDGLKNNLSLKTKLKEAQSLIGRIFEKSKGSE